MVYNLNAHGINSIRDLAEADITYIVEIPGIGPKTAKKLIDMAQKYFEQREKNQVEIAGSNNYSKEESENRENS
jgi:Holliday junction resolvasome RuvABC DNA-binding subunit